MTRLENVSSADARTILEERTRRLSQPTATDEAGGRDRIEVMEFAIGSDRLGLETRYVIEVLPRPEIAMLPKVSGAVRGVVNLRGLLLPVFDLSRILGLPDTASAGGDRLAVIGDGAADFGLLCDETREIVSLPLAEFMPDTLFAAGVAKGLTRGVTRSGLVLLDGSALLKDRRLFVDGGGKEM